MKSLALLLLSTSALAFVQKAPEAGQATAKDGGQATAEALHGLEQQAPGDHAQGHLRKAQFDRRAWRHRLLAPDLDQRELHFDQIIEEAIRSEVARETLTEWAVNPLDMELAWTARLALREVEARGRAGALGLSQLVPGRDFFDLLEQDMPSRKLLEDGARNLDQLQKQLEEFTRGRTGLLQIPKGLKSTQSGQGFKLESGPDGVRVEIQSEQQGEKSTQVYEAETLEQLLKEHPELEQFGLGKGGLGWSFQLPNDLRIQRAPGRIEIVPRLQQPGAPGRVPREVRTDILGVMMHEPLPNEVVAPGLAPGLGLTVERTVPGTIAHILGLRRGDLLIKLGGIELRTGEDVSRALAARKPGSPVLLEIIDGRAKQHTLSWSPEPTKPTKPGER